MKTAWFFAALLMAGNNAAHAQGSAALPQRNLLVELRQTQDEVALSSGATAARGAVVTRSDGTVRGSAESTVATRSREAASGQQVQQLRVLNGGRGALRLSQAVPLQFVQVWWTPQGVEAVPGTTWQDSGSGFTVQPRWPGGTQPVTVELSAESRSADGERRSELLTTVRIPLGEWVTVARSGAEAVERRPGTISTQDYARSEQFALQIRVSAAP